MPMKSSLNSTRLTKREVVILAGAEADLQDLRDYLLRSFGKRTWQRSYHHIKQSILIIQRYLARGTLPGELRDLNLVQFRQAISGMNRIIYEVRDTTIYVHAICDTRL